MILLIVAVVWLAEAPFVVALCRAAASADRALEERASDSHEYPLAA